MKKEDLSENVINYLEECCNSEDWRVREGQAGNPNLPVDFLEILADDNVGEVLEKVASNPNTTTEILTKITLKNLNYENNDQGKVLEKVASNPNISIAMLMKITKYIYELDRKNKNLREKGMPLSDIRYVEEIIKAIIENPNTRNNLKIIEEIRESPPITLMSSFDFLDRIRYKQYMNCKESAKEKMTEIAKDPNTTPQELNQLAESKDSEIRQLVAKHPNLYSKDLEILMWDYVEEVRETAYQNSQKALESGFKNPSHVDDSDPLDVEFEEFGYDEPHDPLEEANNPAEKAEILYGIPDPRLVED